jgi:Lrp/AsnC family leucine-responsive transcriptional regulator
MDSRDLKILKILQTNNRTGSEQIAAAVGLSATAVQRRIKRLRDRGIILQDTSVLSPDALGRKLTVIVEVTLSKGPAYGLDAFKQTVRQTPEITQCYQVTGKADFVLIVSSKDMDDYEAFTRRFFVSNSNVARFETSVVMQRVKVGLSIPFD